MDGITDTEAASTPCTLHVERTGDDTLLLKLAGDWTIRETLPPLESFQKETAGPVKIRRVTFDTGELAGWDSALLTYLLKVVDLCSKGKIQVDQSGLPDGVQKLLHLATAVPERKGARRGEERVSFLARLGDAGIAIYDSAREFIDFLGEAAIALGRLVRGKAQFQRSDLFLLIQETGAQALGIVSLITFLVGLILAFVGALQLRNFGAQLYVADLVGISMLRAMGAIMAAVIMAGRTGASFAASLGTMQVNEEIDALKTMGISPMEFLVLPRFLALTLMMPLLTLYADLMGILGGLFVALTMLDLNFMQFYTQLCQAVTLNHLFVGLASGTVFGILVALAGCLRGMQCGRSSAAVGRATTSAVVTSIVSIVVAQAIITVICDIINV